MVLIEQKYEWIRASSERGQLIWPSPSHLVLSFATGFLSLHCLWLSIDYHIPTFNPLVHSNNISYLLQWQEACCETQKWLGHAYRVILIKQNTFEFWREVKYRCAQCNRHRSRAFEGQPDASVHMPVLVIRHAGRQVILDPVQVSANSVRVSANSSLNTIRTPLIKNRLVQLLLP
jgi:hypothetical protein